MSRYSFRRRLTGWALVVLGILAGLPPMLLLAGTGTAAVLLFLIDIPGLPDLGVVGRIAFVLLLFGASWGLIRVGKSLATCRASELLQDNSQAPILLLRSFGDDRCWDGGQGQAADLKALFGLGIPVPLFLRHLYPSFEEVLENAYRGAGPVIAIGRPGEVLPPPGAARLWVSDDKWQAEVEELLRRCRRVIVILGRTTGHDGLAWEVRSVFSMDDPAKVLVIVPPVGEEEARSRWDQLRLVSGCKLPPYEAGYLVVRFQQGWTPRTGRYHPRGVPCQNDYLNALREVEGLDWQPVRPSGSVAAYLTIIAFLVASFVWSRMEDRFRSHKKSSGRNGDQPTVKITLPVGLGRTVDAEMPIPALEQTPAERAFLKVLVWTMYHEGKVPIDLLEKAIRSSEKEFDAYAGNTPAKQKEVYLSRIASLELMANERRLSYPA